jgi:glucose/arabinose dehydrogenase
VVRIALAASFAALACTALAGPSAAALQLVQVESGFTGPVHVAATKSEPNRVYVVEQRGMIKVVENGNTLSTPFLDIRTRVACCGERGLLSLAFHPKYPQVRRIYVNFTNNDGDTRVVEYRVNEARTQAVVSTARILLRVNQPFSNHNGGQVLFGMHGHLFVPTGDGGSGGDPGNRAQSMRTRLGKLVRINVTNGNKRIVALGLRNPWRVSLDRATGRMFLADVGQGSREEVSMWRQRWQGLENYGWRRFEGTRLYSRGTRLYRSSRLRQPVHEYAHGSGRCSITGGHVYRGSAVPRLRGRYFLGDYCTGEVWSFSVGSNGRKRGFMEHPNLRVSNGLPSFGLGPTGEVFLVSHGNGTLYRIGGS